MIVHFRGGPLGGEVREVPDDWWPRVRVPALSYVGFSYTAADPMPLPSMMTEIEEYELRPAPFYGGPDDWKRHMDGIWINPNARLLKKNSELEARIRELENLQRILDGVKAYFKT